MNRTRWANAGIRAAMLGLLGTSALFAAMSFGGSAAAQGNRWGQPAGPGYHPPQVSLPSQPSAMPPGSGAMQPHAQHPATPPLGNAPQASLPPAGHEPPGGIRWATNLPAAQREAAQTDKLVLIHFWGPDCAPCRRLEATVFTQPIVAEQIHRYYVPVKVNVQQYPHTARQYGVDQMPTEVVFDPMSSNVLHRGLSPLDAQAYMTMLADVAAANAGGRRAPEALAGNAPAGDWNGSAWNSQPSGPAAHSGQGDWGQPAQFAQQTPPPSQQALQTQHNNYPQHNYPQHDSAWQQQPAGPPAQFAQQTPPPSHSANAAQPFQQPHAAGGSFQPASMQQPSVDARDSQWNGGLQGYERPAGAAQANHAPSNPAAATSSPGGAANADEPKIAAGNPPLAIAGYCPVTLAQEQVWKRGDVRYGAAHRGRTYLFTGAEHQQTFLRDPDRYAPALGGCDAVLFASRGEYAAGLPKFGFFYRGQAYLFQSAETLQAFEANAGHYSAVAIEAMRDEAQGLMRR